MGHTGDLKTDSPALFGELKRRFSIEEASRVSAEYTTCVSNGGLNEGLIVRDPEVSFNPRPARICLILLKELKEVSIGELLEVLKLETLQQPTLTALPSVKLALIVDELRHLHMTKLSSQEIRARIREIQRDLASYQDEALARLKLISESAISNLLRMYE